MNRISQGLQLAEKFPLKFLIGRRLDSRLVHPIANLRFFLHLTGKTRRFFLVHFRKKYVRQQLETREGQCRQCGFCCNMLLTCPLLTKEGTCVAYGKCRPSSCKVFPIDNRDIDEVRLCGGRCGYHFDVSKPLSLPSQKGI